MNKFFSDILDWFKNIFGIKPEKKTKKELQSDFFNTDGISITSALSERLTTLTISGAEATIEGGNKRAEYLQSVIDWIYQRKLSAIGQTSLGTGDCIVKPNTDGKRIGMDIIGNQDFVIVDSIGDFIYSALIKCDQLEKDKHVFERWEYHKLSEVNGITYSTITQVAFEDGKKIDISDVPAWSMLKENQVIPNVDRLLFGRFKCPKLNRKDINSANGVPITFGAEEIVEEAKASWRRFNDEFARKEAFVFADKRVFKTKKMVGANGKTVEQSVLPDGKDRLIMTVNGSTQIDGSPLIQEYSPEIRDTSLNTEIQTNFKMLELFLGLDSGILSTSEEKYVNLDETRKSTQNTYAFITNFRKVLESGLNDLMYAVNVICNYNELTPYGEYSINYDWSDSFVESMTERFNELLQSLNMNTITRAEFRSWVMNEPLEIAEQKIAEMNEAEVIE